MENRPRLTPPPRHAAIRLCAIERIISADRLYSLLPNSIPVPLTLLSPREATHLPPMNSTASNCFSLLCIRLLGRVGCGNQTRTRSESGVPSNPAMETTCRNRRKKSSNDWCVCKCVSRLRQNHGAPSTNAQNRSIVHGIPYLWGSPTTRWRGL